MIHKFEADGIWLEFGMKRILQDIYLKCETGTITGLLGRNGSGKSCLMQIIYGSLKCEKSIRFDDVRQSEVYKRPDLMLYLPQFNFIPKHLSLKRVFKDYKLVFDEFTTRFPEYSEKYKFSVSHLSGGEHRLIELYLIVKSPSQFAMLDEPFTHLSPLQVENVKALLEEEKKTKGFFITDHMHRHITEISDRLYVLKDGKTHLTTTKDDIARLGYLPFYEEG